MKTKTSFILMTTITVLFVFASSSHAQDSDLLAALGKQSSAPKLKVVLMGAVPETKGTTQYHKIILQVTNRNTLNREMFINPQPVQLPPNPCKRARTRLVAGVYDAVGPAVSSCIAIGSRDELDGLSFLIEKGKTIPKFVYVVLTDLKTGSAFKSNLVSPMDGSTK